MICNVSSLDPSKSTNLFYAKVTTCASYPVTAAPLHRIHPETEYSSAP